MSSSVVEQLLCLCFYCLFLSIVSIYCFYCLFLLFVSIYCFYCLFLLFVSIDCFYWLFLSIVSMFLLIVSKLNNTSSVNFIPQKLKPTPHTYMHPITNKMSICSNNSSICLFLSSIIVSCFFAKGSSDKAIQHYLSPDMSFFIVFHLILFLSCQFQTKWSDINYLPLLDNQKLPPIIRQICWKPPSSSLLFWKAREFI